MTISRLADLPDILPADLHGDIRGWKLIDRNGHKFGIIDDLIIDTDTCTIREIVVYIDENRKDVRIPIGAVALDEHHQTATTQASHDEVLAMPEIKEWHSRERQLLRATFFPQLADAPILGELEKDDEYFKSKEPRVGQMESTLWSFRNR
jgi:hypothetical protein